MIEMEHREKEKIEGLIARGKIDGALSELGRWAVDPSTKRSLKMIATSYHRLKKDVMNEVISYDDELVHSARINQRVLLLVENMEEEFVAKKRKIRLRRWIAGISILALVAASIFVILMLGPESDNTSTKDNTEENRYSPLILIDTLSQTP